MRKSNHPAFYALCRQYNLISDNTPTLNYDVDTDPDSSDSSDSDSEAEESLPPPPATQRSNSRVRFLPTTTTTTTTTPRIMSTQDFYNSTNDIGKVFVVACLTGVISVQFWQNKNLENTKLFVSEDGRSVKMKIKKLTTDTTVTEQLQKMGDGYTSWANDQDNHLIVAFNAALKANQKKRKEAGDDGFETVVVCRLHTKVLPHFVDRNGNKIASGNNQASYFQEPETGEQKISFFLRTVDSVNDMSNRTQMFVKSTFSPSGGSAGMETSSGGDLARSSEKNDQMAALIQGLGSLTTSIKGMEMRINEQQKGLDEIRAGSTNMFGSPQTPDFKSTPAFGAPPHTGSNLFGAPTLQESGSNPFAMAQQQQKHEQQLREQQEREQQLRE